MEKLLSISEAANVLGVSISTLRRWEKEGELLPDACAKGGQRRYRLSTLIPETKRKMNYKRKTTAYARGSSSDQKEDLGRQKRVLKLFCASNGWDCEIISDLGSGINYRKKGLKKLIENMEKAVEDATCPQD